MSGLENNKLLQFYDLAKSSDSEDDYSKIELPSKRYKVKKLLGEGGTKKVFEVQDFLAERKVALAMPKPDLPKKMHSSFMKEAKMNAKLDHPNIIKVLDIGVSKTNTPFFTMELKRGHTLKTHIEKQKFDQLTNTELKEKIEIILKICDALCYAHSKGLIHMDIKPSNIQVGKFGDIMLCDWGISQVNEDEEELKLIETSEETFDPNIYKDLTRIGRIKGTPGYMAPEQWHPDQDLSFQTDIFALGVLLLEVISGLMPPPTTEGAASTIREIKRRLKNTKIPISLKAIIKQATSAKKIDRYASMEHFKNDLEMFISGFSPMAESASLLKKAQLFYHRNQKRILLVSSIIILITTIVSIFMSMFQDYEEERVQFIAQDEKSSLELQDWQNYYRELNSFDLPDIDPNDIYDIIKDHGVYYKVVEVFLLSNNLKYEKSHNYEMLTISAFIYFVRQNFERCLSLIEDNKDRFITLESDINILKLKSIAEKALLFPRNEQYLIKEEFIEELILLCLNEGNAELAKLLIANDISKRPSRKVYEKIFSNHFNKLIKHGNEFIAYDSSEHKLELQLGYFNMKSFTDTPFFFRCSHLVLTGTRPISYSSISKVKPKFLTIYGTTIDKPTNLSRIKELSIIEVDQEFLKDFTSKNLKRKKVFANANSIK